MQWSLQTVTIKPVIFYFIICGMHITPEMGCFYYYVNFLTFGPIEYHNKTFLLQLKLLLNSNFWSHHIALFSCWTSCLCTGMVSATEMRSHSLNDCDPNDVMTDCIVMMLVFGWFIVDVHAACLLFFTELVWESAARDVSYSELLIRLQYCDASCKVTVSSCLES